jgi:DNA polymerase-1
MPVWNVELPPAEWLDPDLEMTGQTISLNGLPAIMRLVEELRHISLIAIDTETTGLNKVRDLPLFWSLAWEDDNLQPRRVCMPASTLQYFTDIFNDPYKQWIFANAKYDCAILANVGINVAGELYDVIVMHSLLYEDMPHDLKSMAEHVLGYRWNDFKDTFDFSKIGKLTQNSTPDEVKAGGRFQTVQDAILWCRRNDLSKLVEYATNDAWGTYQIYQELFKRLRDAPTQSCMQPTPEWVSQQFQTVADVYYQVEAPFTRVLFECERAGITIDQAYLQSLDKPMNDDMNAIAREVTHVSAKAGAPILNLNSNKELSHYLYDVKKYPVTKYTKGGKKGIRAPSVDDATLTRLESMYDDPVLDLKRQFGDIKKLHGTYVVGMLDRVQPNGRIHTDFNQHVAVTGRLSSSNPNLQNIKRPDEDKEADRYNIRRAFIAPPGHKLIVADYEQLEMRLLAIMSGEQDMLDIFLRGHDIHMGNASLVFDIPYDDIKRAKKMKDEEWTVLSKDEADYFHRCLRARQDAKTIGFGLNYGMQRWTLAKRLGCTPDEAQDKIDAYMARYPAVAHYFATSIATPQETGFAYTLLGRRRYLPDIIAEGNEERSRAERQASNVPIQGTAADVVKTSMIRCHDARLKDRFGCVMLVQVHDELVFECPEETSEQAAAVIRDCMEHAFPEDFAIPLGISLGIADNWSQAK